MRTNVVLGLSAVLLALLLFMLLFVEFGEGNLGVAASVNDGDGSGSGSGGGSGGRNCVIDFEKPNDGYGCRQGIDFVEY